MSKTTITLKAESAGGNSGNFARISCNDKEIDFGNYTRGLNVAVFDRTTGQILTCATFDTYIANNGESFAYLIENIPTGSIVAIAVLDDASTHLFSEPRTKEQIQKAFESIGSIRYPNLSFRSSWVLIGEKGTQPGSATEAVSEFAPVSVTYSFDAETIAPRPLVGVTSVSSVHRGEAAITVNGTKVAIEGGYRPGLNVAVFDNQANLIKSATFDVKEAAEADAFVRFIDSLPIGQEVAIAMNGAYENSLPESVKNACASLGSLKVYYVYQKGIWGMVGAKGAPFGTAVENVDNGYQFYPYEYSFLIQDGVYVRSWVTVKVPDVPTGKQQEWKFKQKFLPTDIERESYFGISVAQDGKFAIVGAYKANSGDKPNTGAAYIFQWENNSWQFKQKLQPADLKQGDHFGYSVVLNGEFAIVGAYKANSQNKPSAGAAYVFRLENNSWQLQQKLQPYDLNSEDYFGSSVAINGKNAIIGSFNANSSRKLDTGAAYFFQLENGIWQQKQKLQPADLGYKYHFGYSISLKGGVALVGAYRADAPGKMDAGAAYIFQLENGLWQQKQKLQPTELGHEENFGISVALSGTQAIIGAYRGGSINKSRVGAAYIFQLENGTWQQKQKLQPTDLQPNAYFGTSVTVDGNVAIVGSSHTHAPGKPRVGAAYIFQLENGTWQQKQKLQPAELLQEDNFAISVALKGDLAIVGVPRSVAESKLNAGAFCAFQYE